MVYPATDRRKGWLWEHRIPVIAVCFAVFILGVIAAYDSLFSFPLGILVGIAVLVSVLVILYLSMVSRSPRPSLKPASSVGGVSRI
ncbi:MAG TPA: hypothetical protein VEB87_03685 [Nitrososphaerales archaeon]|nr:hypothetical protein [Nitrososphaerales archaeon]